MSAKGVTSQGWICILAWPPAFFVTLGKSLSLQTYRLGWGLKRETLIGGGFTDPQEKTNRQIWPNLPRLKRPEPVTGSQRRLGSHGTFWKHGLSPWWGAALALGMAQGQKCLINRAPAHDKAASFITYSFKMSHQTFMKDE